MREEVDRGGGERVVLKGTLYSVNEQLVKHVYYRTFFKVALSLKGTVSRRTIISRRPRLTSRYILLL